MKKKTCNRAVIRIALAIAVPLGIGAPATAQQNEGGITVYRGAPPRETPPAGAPR